MPPTAVSCTNLSKRFGEGDSAVPALRDVGVAVHPGELTLLVGPSGCGKTTLISVIAGLLEPSAGEVEVFGVNQTRLSPGKKLAFRRDHIGFVFQQYNLLPALTTVENVAVPLLIAGWKRPRALEKAAPCSSGWAWRTAWIIGPACFRAVSSSAWPSRAR